MDASLHFGLAILSLEKSFQGACAGHEGQFRARRLADTADNLAILIAQETTPPEVRNRVIERDPVFAEK